MFERLDMGYVEKQVKEKDLKKFCSKCSRKRAKNDVSEVRSGVRREEHD